MTAEEVWIKYKHMDKVLSDGRESMDSFRSQIIADLWAAIIHTIQEKVVGYKRSTALTPGEPETGRR